MQQTSAGKDLGAADFACGFLFCLLRSARPAWIRLTMAATMLTAVDTAPRDDQYGNQWCHEFTADALLNHK